jgi:ATPase family associated with various cellular activities (AAA)/Winged helix domain, variant
VTGRRTAPRQAERIIPDWSALGTALVEQAVARTPDGDGTRPSDAAAAAVTHAEAQLREAAAGDGPFAAMVTMATLDEAATRVLAVCAAIALDRRLQRLASTLRHDPAAEELDVDVLTRLLGADALEQLADEAPLICACLLEIEHGGPLAAAAVTVARRVTWALTGDGSLDPDLPLHTELVVAPPFAIGMDDLVVVHGEDRVRRLQAAVVRAGALGFIVVSEPTEIAHWRALVREATVSGLGIVLELAEPLTPLGRYWIERADHLAWALSSRDPLPLDTLPDREFVEIAAHDARVSDDEWTAVFPSCEPSARRPTADQLRLARTVARAGADPQEAIRRVASGSLLRHATRVVPKVAWDDLVFSDSALATLHDLVDRYRFRSVVHEQWGLPLYPSPGVVALFSGPSGTGKTTTAEAIAHDLGMDMFRIDLSALVSKYIGETEKNLEEIFSAAHAGDYLLLFDEADSLFGARSKVSDARDRYANMEVSYLLQRLETYDGFVILTSNFQGNIDPAFLRRIHVTVNFPVPGAADRARIWALSLARAPQDGLDLNFVAEQFDFSGGSIRNAALTAAFRAAGAGRAVDMADVLHAVIQEMAKLRRRPNDHQFGRWLADVKKLSTG